MFDVVGEKLISYSKAFFWITVICAEILFFLELFLYGELFKWALYAFLFPLCCWYVYAAIVGFAKIVKNLEEGNGAFIFRSAEASTAEAPELPSFNAPVTSTDNDARPQLPAL